MFQVVYVYAMLFAVSDVHDSYGRAESKRHHSFKSVSMLRLVTSLFQVLFSYVYNQIGQFVPIFRTFKETVVFIQGLGEHLFVSPHA
jgi:hypothetical protein